MPQGYISRTLLCDGIIVRDEAIVGKAGVFVVLAEPGAGKSELLDYLAHRSGVLSLRAGLLPPGPFAGATVVIVDALDEVARIDEAATDRILTSVRSADARTIVLASRSYAWDEAGVPREQWPEMLVTPARLCHNPRAQGRPSR